MTLVENYAAERTARLMRLGRIPKPEPKKKAAPGLDPAPYYSQMWFYDLIAPKPLKKPKPSVLAIREVVCRYFDLLPQEVESSRRQGVLVYPRQIAFYLARTLTNYSYPQIGRRFGDRDHTTIMHGSKKIERLIKEDWCVAYDIAHLEAML